MHTIKITPNLLFEYRCTSGKLVRLPNRIETSCPNWNALPSASCVHHTSYLQRRCVGCNLHTPTVHMYILEAMLCSHSIPLLSTDQPTPPPTTSTRSHLMSLAWAYSFRGGGGGGGLAPKFLTVDDIFLSKRNILLRKEERFALIPFKLREIR